MRGAAPAGKKLPRPPSWHGFRKGSGRIREGFSLCHDRGLPEKLLPLCPAASGESHWALSLHCHSHTMLSGHRWEDVPQNEERRGPTCPPEEGSVFSPQSPGWSVPSSSSDPVFSVRIPGKQWGQCSPAIPLAWKGRALEVTIMLKSICWVCSSGREKGQKEPAALCSVLWAGSQLSAPADFPSRASAG